MPPCLTLEYQRMFVLHLMVSLSFVLRDVGRRDGDATKIRITLRRQRDRDSYAPSATVYVNVRAVKNDEEKLCSLRS